MEIKIEIPHNTFQKNQKEIENIISNTDEKLGKIDNKVKTSQKDDRPLIEQIEKNKRRKLKEKMEEIEKKLYYSQGWSMHSGGFAEAELTDFDEQFFYITIREGIQNDAENRVYTDWIEIDKETLEPIKK